MTSLTVILPVRNEERCLAGALDALLSQSRPADRIIAVNDASTDSTLRILRAYELKAGSLKVLTTREHIGLHRAIDWALETTASRNEADEYVYATAGNDVVLPGAFEALMGLAETYPGAALVSGNIAAIDPDEQSHWAPLLWGNVPTFVEPARVAEIVPASIIHGGATAFRRDRFLEAGGFIEDLLWLGDTWPLHTLALRHGFAYAPTVISGARLHPNRVSDRIRNQEDLIRVGKCWIALLNAPAAADIRTALIRSGLMGIREIAAPVNAAIRAMAAEMVPA